MRKLLLAISLGALPIAAAAQVLDFEGIGFTQFAANLNGYDLANTNSFPGHPTPDYGQLRWSSGFRVLESASWLARNAWQNLPAGGFHQGLVSGSYVAFNGGGASVHFEALNPGEYFNLTSAYMAAAWYDGLQVDVAGYRDGQQVYSLRTGPLGYGASLVSFDWTGLDKVSFSSVADTGMVIDGQSTYNRAFVLDGLAVAPVPEPAEWALMLAGLGVVGALARRRRARLC